MLAITIPYIQLFWKSYLKQLERGRKTALRKHSFLNKYKLILKEQFWNNFLSQKLFFIGKHTGKKYV